MKVRKNIRTLQFFSGVNNFGILQINKKNIKFIKYEIRPKGGC